MPCRDPEKMREYQRRWRAANPDYNREYKRKNRIRTNPIPVPPPDPMVKSLLIKWGVVGPAPAGWPPLVISDLRTCLNQTLRQ